MIPVTSIDSFCESPARCERYVHCHCTRCRRVMLAIAEGPIYGSGRPTVDGYEDAVLCSVCRDSFYMICTDCAATDPRCLPCQLEGASAA